MSMMMMMMMMIPMMMMMMIKLQCGSSGAEQVGFQCLLTATKASYVHQLSRLANDGGGGDDDDDGFDGYNN